MFDDVASKVPSDGDLASVLDLAVLARELQLREREPDTLRAFCVLAAELLHADHVAFAAVTRGGFRVLATTSQVPVNVAKIQLALNEGPSVAALGGAGPVRTGDLGHDERWPTVRRGRVVTRTGMRSMMSLPAVAGERTIGTLDAYAERKDAFQDEDQALGTVLAAHAAAALEQVHAQDRAEYLAELLGRNRRIGTATGILMVRRRWSESQAFEAMAFEATWRYARDSTTRIVDVADEIIRTGGLGGRVRGDLT
jgi:GAF domain-containing protein